MSLSSAKSDAQYARQAADTNTPEAIRRLASAISHLVSYLEDMNRPSAGRDMMG